MCGIVGGVTTLVVGAALVIASTVVNFIVVPGLIENLIINVSKHHLSIFNIVFLRLEL